MTTVLVVDDEAHIRSSLRGILLEEGMHVVEAANGREALALLEQCRPDLVVLDVWMPEVDGLEFLRAIQNRAQAPAVLMISGHGNIETAVKATQLGAVDFIEKPFSLGGFLGAVERALRRQQVQNQQDPHPASPLPTSSRSVEGVAPQVRGRFRQRTVARSMVDTGTGLHSGVKTGLILQPMPPDSGIVFSNLSAETPVPAHLDFVDSTGYATTLHRAGVTIRTVEHLLAALHAYRVTNLFVKVQGEVPIMDGSAQRWCELIESAGVEEQDAWAEEYAVREAVEIRRSEEEWIRIEPFDGLAVTYVLEYPPPVGRQEYSFVLQDPRSFREQIAPARTFGFVKDMKLLASMGLASGGRLDNCILIDDEKIVNTTLRFPEELARHKILDICGDMYLLGRPLRGKITAKRTGHSENIALLRKLRSQFEG